MGYSNLEYRISKTEQPLPHLRPGVFRTRDRMPHVKKPDLMRLDNDYASNYHISTDISILLINLFKI